MPQKDRLENFQLNRSSTRDLPVVQDLVSLIFFGDCLLPSNVTGAAPCILDRESLTCGGKRGEPRKLLLHDTPVALPNTNGSVISKQIMVVKSEVRLARSVVDVHVPRDPVFHSQSNMAYQMLYDLLRVMYVPLTTWCCCLAGCYINVILRHTEKVYQPGSACPVKGYCQYKRKDGSQQIYQYQVYLSLSDHDSWFDFAHTIIHELAHALSPEDPEGHGIVWVRRFAMLCAWVRHSTERVSVLDDFEAYRGWRERLMPILNILPTAVNKEKEHLKSHSTTAKSVLHESPLCLKTTEVLMDCGESSDEEYIIAKMKNIGLHDQKNLMHSSNKLEIRSHGKAKRPEVPSMFTSIQNKRPSHSSLLPSNSSQQKYASKHLTSSSQAVSTKASNSRNNLKNSERCSINSNDDFAVSIDTESISDVSSIRDMLEDSEACSVQSDKQCEGRLLEPADSGHPAALYSCEWLKLRDTEQHSSPSRQRVKFSSEPLQLCVQR